MRGVDGHRMHSFKHHPDQRTFSVFGNFAVPICCLCLDWGFFALFQRFLHVVDRQSIVFVFGGCWWLRCGNAAVVKMLLW